VEHEVAGKASRAELRLGRRSDRMALGAIFAYEGSVGQPAFYGALGVSQAVCGKRPPVGQPRGLNSGKVIDYRDILR